MGNRCFSEYIFLSLSPLVPTHCRCRGLLLHLLTLGDTNTHLLDTTSVNEESARRKHLYLTTHTHTHTHTQHSQQRQSSRQRDSKRHSQQSIGRQPTPLTRRPPGSGEYFRLEFEKLVIWSLITERPLCDAALPTESWVPFIS